jgi:hypothetical protein
LFYTIKQVLGIWAAESSSFRRCFTQPGHLAKGNLNHVLLPSLRGPAPDSSNRLLISSSYFSFSSLAIIRGAKNGCPWSFGYLAISLGTPKLFKTSQSPISLLQALLTSTGTLHSVVHASLRSTLLQSSFFP